MEFFTKLGYTFNLQFTDGNAACMIVSENIFVMPVVEKFFQTFTGKPICDATKSTEVLIGLSCPSRAEVDEVVRKAVAAGGHRRECRKIRASCTGMAMKTWMDIYGKYFIWSPA